MKRLWIVVMLLAAACGSAPVPQRATELCKNFGGVRSYYSPDWKMVTTCNDGAFFSSFDVANCGPHGGVRDTTDLGTHSADVFCNDGSLMHEPANEDGTKQ